ncbi:MAG: hypothetical protein QM820_22020 [Minicystis sp.]
MSPPDLEPLDADLDALLASERDRPKAAPDVHARVLGRVMTTIGSGGPGGGSSPGAPPAGAGFGGALAKPILLGAALGSIVAGVIVTRPDPIDAQPAAVITTVEPRPPAAPSVVPAPEPVAATASPVPEHAGAAGAPPSSPRARASVEEPGRDESLAAERRLLDEAQRALAEGRSAAAQEALDRHAREFPRGRLGEEREALSIRALARAGRMEEARARADRFRAAHPRSILLPAIEATVGTIP